MAKVNCPTCGGKGWVEDWYVAGGRNTMSLLQCYRRCNIKGYSDEVQKRHCLRSPVEIQPPTPVNDDPEMGNLITGYFPPRDSH